MSKQKKYVVTVRVATPIYEEYTVHAPSKKEAIAAVKDNVSWRNKSNFAHGTGFIESDIRKGTCIEDNGSYNPVSYEDPRNPTEKFVVEPIILQVDQLNKS